eukprot:CAMPEP_0184865802 /NCGR_PEP_ID=MMETSP0580-20130426/19129_1 /TAXON_ID=1118495 /ORGANISM="Dactyliosolen fragilissimus" /LENGTH=966 /DNA_ID=CAMNT_0027365131 /DNA_START=309 /DNA_END=3209 /DNA_ORIENTATION=+
MALGTSAGIPNLKYTKFPCVNTSISLQKKYNHSSTFTDQLKDLRAIRNVGVMAHVDAGKTTVTERMLALAGAVRVAGSVDHGNTVTDYLPAERERGITIQSAAISFPWVWYNSNLLRNCAFDPDSDSNLNVDHLHPKINHPDVQPNEIKVHLIDTPGHVDFGVEVNRCVAVLDGAVLVVDAVAGVQAQTETVWRAITRTDHGHHHHQPLPSVIFINKMDRDGRDFGKALLSIQNGLVDSNPLPIQIPIYRYDSSSTHIHDSSSILLSPDEIDDTSSTSAMHLQYNQLLQNIVAVPPKTHPKQSATKVNNIAATSGPFVGVVDLIHMRAIIWPDIPSENVSDVESCIPTIIPLLHHTIDSSHPIVQSATLARHDLIASLADHDSTMEDFFLMEKDPSNEDLLVALRKATLKRHITPVLAGAALRGKGVEPLLDSIADLLPSPLDRNAPNLTKLETQTNNHDDNANSNKTNNNLIPVGHPLHPSLLALAFKVVHMKNRGGSGDGRVVFARIYSGKISTKDTLRVISPANQGIESTKYGKNYNNNKKVRVERVGGMLELAGGRFNNMNNGVCNSGDVCALVGLKSVVTGDTLLLSSDISNNLKKSRGNSKNKSKNQYAHISEENLINFDMDTISGGDIYLSGVASPSPVLTVRLEAESSDHQAKLSHALSLLAIEDPSLHIEETESTTLLSGLGELHIEIVLDRLKREHGLDVWTGQPSVAFRETILEKIETPGLVQYERLIGTTHMQAAIHLILEPMVPKYDSSVSATSNAVLHPFDPIVSIGKSAREYLGIDEGIDEVDLIHVSETAEALISGCRGALQRGVIGSHPIANVHCQIVDVASPDGLSSLINSPGILRAAASSIVRSTMMPDEGKPDPSCTILEPFMDVEITVPTDKVGPVISDLNSRRGSVGDVDMDNNSQRKSLVRALVPLVEMLGYASSLRSITGGEASFTAEYKSHMPCDSETIHR